MKFEQMLCDHGMVTHMSSYRSEHSQHHADTANSNEPTNPFHHKRAPLHIQQVEHQLQGFCQELHHQHTAGFFRVATLNNCDAQHHQTSGFFRVASPNNCVEVALLAHLVHHALSKSIIHGDLSHISIANNSSQVDAASSYKS